MYENKFTNSHTRLYTSIIYLHNIYIQYVYWIRIYYVYKRMNYIFTYDIYKFICWNIVWNMEKGENRTSISPLPIKPTSHLLTHPPNRAHTHARPILIPYTKAYLLWPYLSGRDAHFVMMSDLYRVDDLIIIGSDVPHQLLVLSIIPQESFHFPYNTPNENNIQNSLQHGWL